MQIRQELANSADQQQETPATQLQKLFPNLAQKLSESQSGTTDHNQPTDACNSTTTIGMLNKCIADIQTSAMMGDKRLQFWLDSCPKACSHKLDGCIVLNEHNTVFASNRSAICNRCFPGPIRILDANGISIVSAVFAGLNR